MSEQYRRRTFGEELACIEAEIVRLGRYPNRREELESNRQALIDTRAFMAAHGKRKSSAFYGITEQVAAQTQDSSHD